MTHNPKQKQKMDTKGCIDNCNKLLRGEISAIETYDQAIEKFEDQTGVETLRKIRESHSQHAQKLRAHVLSMNGEASESSGVWGMFAQAVEGTAKVFGDTAALQALVAGEEHGVNEYKGALEDEDVMDEIKGEIRNAILPTIERNIADLKQLKAFA